jgi:hypothetical protein
VYAYRLQAAILDRAEQRADAIDEGFAADEADVFMLLGLPGEVLARAEPNLEPHFAQRHRKELPQVLCWRCLQIEAKC